MIKIYYDTNNLIILVDGVKASSEIILKDTCKHSLLLLPLAETIPLHPIATYISQATSGELSTTIDYIEMEENQYYLSPQFLPYLNNLTPTINTQLEYGEHKITVYTDNITHIAIENANNFIDVILPTIPIEITHTELTSGTLFVIRGEHNLCLIIYNYYDYSCILDKVCDSFDFTEDGVDFSTFLSDNQGRIITEHYSFIDNNYICNNICYNYTNRHNCIDELLPIDFMQAILYKDYEYAYNLLDTELNLDIATLQDYFGELIEITNISQYVTSHQVYVIVKCDNKKKCQKYQFKTRSGKIIDIDLI